MITPLPKSAWRYGIQIVMLFAIAALTATLLIAHLEEQIGGPNREEIIWQLSVSIWSLTMGFMFLSGALGLWAIRSTVEIEGRRRIGRFVDAMDYLSDGLLALDTKGRIIGSNPAAREWFRESESGIEPLGIHDAFPGLTPDDADMLMRARHPREVQVDCVSKRGLRALRFRSQPSEGIILLLVSDVTETRSLEIRRQHIAQLQLIGRIAGGVAYDFNDILCAIAGHVALLKRADIDFESKEKSLDIIGKETGKGALLSRMLLELSRTGQYGEACEKPADNIKEAASLLKVALSPGWKVRVAADDGCPSVPLTPAQIEQVVLNLGLLASDALPRPGIIVVTLNRPGQEHLLAVEDKFAAVILISAHASDAELESQETIRLNNTVPISDESGVILSVVRSIVEEADGRMDHLSAPGGLSVFRICLPHLDISGEDEEKTLIPPDELNVYISRWKVLLGGAGDRMEAFCRGLLKLGTEADRKTEIVSFLAALQSPDDLNAVVLEKDLLGGESESLLRAIIKLAPHAAIVVLCPDPGGESTVLRSMVVFEKSSAGPQELVRAMVEAKTLARARFRTVPAADVIIPVLS